MGAKVTNRGHNRLQSGLTLIGFAWCVRVSSRKTVHLPENFVLNSKYKHLFFDLDRTLWDFEKSAAETFEDIYHRFGFQAAGIGSPQQFFDTYTHHNEHLWDLYREGKIEKEVLRGLRFNLTLKDFGIHNPEMAEEIGDYYVEESPRKVNLFPYSHEILRYLQPKYQLHLITNGFSEVQEVKLQCSDLRQYFIQVITSEDAGAKKPDEAIFHFAFGQTGALPSESLMIGDDLGVDILGAKLVGMDQVLFDPYCLHPADAATYYIRDLKELENLL